MCALVFVSQRTAYHAEFNPKTQTTEYKPQLKQEGTTPCARDNTEQKSKASKAKFTQGQNTQHKLVEP